MHAEVVSLPDMKSRLLQLMAGCPPAGFPSIGERMRDYSGWLQSAGVVVRFEDLVGERGGGSADAQRQAIESIFQGLGLSVDAATVGSVQADSFSDRSPTFRRGATGQWRQHFDAEAKERFKTIAGAELIRYGYERSQDW